MLHKNTDIIRVKPNNKTSYQPDNDISHMVTDNRSETPTPAPKDGSLLLNSPQRFYGDQTLFMKIVPVKLYGQKNIVINTFALFDEGAKLYLIEESIANQLGLDDDGLQDLHLSWYGGRTTTEPSCSVNLEISGVRANARMYDIINARTVHDLQLLKQTVCVADLHSCYRSIKRLPVNDYSDAVP